MNGLFQNAAVNCVALVLLVQAVAFYAVPRQEVIPEAKPLSEFSASVGPWAVVRENTIEPEIQEILKADDTLNRDYAAPDMGQVNLFIAFFRSQRAGQQPHSPKVCLPGSGWTPEDARYIDVKVPGLDEPITVNRYTVVRGDRRSVVLYWYQSHQRVVASEYKAKLYTILDSIRYRRSDASLVRVVVPVENGGIAAANAIAESFVQTFFQPVRTHLPQA